MVFKKVVHICKNSENQKLNKFIINGKHGGEHAW